MYYASATVQPTYKSPKIQPVFKGPMKFTETTGEIRFVVPNFMEQQLRFQAHLEQNKEI